MSAAKETPDAYGLKAKIRADKKKININLTNYAKAFKNIQTKSDIDDVVNIFRELLEKEFEENTIIKFC